MRRLIAISLLLLAIAGTFAPAAFAFTATDAHACCRRTAARHCHESSPDSGLALRSIGCCGGNCQGAVTSAQWAHPHPTAAARFQRVLATHVVAARSFSPTASFFRSSFTRGPPSC